MEESIYKYIIVGDEGVGKTSISLRYTNNVFYKQQTTIGVDFFSRTNGNTKIKIWDTAGACRFKSIIKSFYRYAVGAIIVYDITNKNSFMSVSSWFKEIKEHTNDECYIMLIGNKIDKEDKRQVSTNEGKELANTLGIPFFEVSAKDSTNVESSFYFFNNLFSQKNIEDYKNTLTGLYKEEKNTCYNC